MATAETVHREMLDAWNRRDFDGMRALFHADYTYVGGDGQTQSGGPDMGIDIARGYAAAFPDGRAEVKSTMVQGNSAISHWRD